MSITPVDKPPDGDDDGDSARQRRSSLLREYVRRLAAWLGDRAAETRLRPGTDEDARSTGRRHQNQLVERDATPVKPSDCPAFENFPERDRPLTYPARNLPGINTPDVVCIETDDGLRLSVPDNPDAALTSDVWIPVEP